MHELLEDPKSPGYHRAKVAENLYHYAVRACEEAELPLSSIRVELWACGRLGGRRCYNALVNVLRFDGARWAISNDFPPDTAPMQWQGFGQLGSCYLWIEGERPEELRAIKQPNKDLYKIPLYSYQENGSHQHTKHAMAYRQAVERACARDIYFCDMKNKRGPV